MWSVCGDSVCNETKIQNCSHKYMNTHKNHDIFNGSFGHIFNAMFSMVVESEQIGFEKHCCLVTHTSMYITYQVMFNKETACNILNPQSEPKLKLEYC